MLQQGSAKDLNGPLGPMNNGSPPTGADRDVQALPTPRAAFILSGTMAVAYFYAHAPRGFYLILNQGELAVLYCFVFLYLAAAGGRPWRADAGWGRAAD